MNRILLRSATLFALLTFCLPAVAQRVQFWTQGAAYVAAEEKAIAEDALVRVLGGPPSGKGQIVFFRSTRSASSDVEVRENGNEIAKLSGGSYFIVAASPGTHAFTVNAETGETLTVQVKPGGTHFVKVGTRRADDDRSYLLHADAMSFLDVAGGGRHLSVL